MKDVFPALIDRHKNEVCVILGNGPSIADYDLSDPFFTENITIGSNYIGQVFLPTYYLITDAEAYRRWSQLMFNGTSVPVIHKTLLSRASGHKGYTCNYQFWDSVGEPKKGRIVHGRTSGVVMLHLAYSMGFKYFFILGIDGYRCTGRTHFYGSITRRPSSDGLVQRCLTLFRNRLVSEGKFIFNLSHRSVHHQIPKWWDVQAELQVAENNSEK